MIDAKMAKQETEKNRIKRKKEIEKEIAKKYKKAVKIISRKIIKEVKDGNDKCVVTISYNLVPIIPDYLSNLSFNVETLYQDYFDGTVQLKITWEDKN